jgi:hypothetical protein
MLFTLHVQCKCAATSVTHEADTDDMKIVHYVVAMELNHTARPKICAQHLFLHLDHHRKIKHIFKFKHIHRH